MKTESNVKYVIRLAATLLIITSLVALALAGINSITAPIIAQKTYEKTQQAIVAVLPGGGEEMDVNAVGFEGAELVSKVYKGENGYAIDFQESSIYGSCIAVPVRDKDGLIQGLKIRLDDADEPNRKYRWLSSRGRTMQNGTRSYSWIHITGDRTRKRAFLTEGPLKGDVASYLAKDALFICTGGVNAIKGLRETILDLGVTEIVEAMDMDQMTNPQVRQAILTMRKEVQTIPGLRYSKYTWNPDYKGVDDYFLSRVAAM